MIVTTTDSLQGYEIEDYIGLVMGETILGANIIRDLLATITDITGGRSGVYEEELAKARKSALDEMSEKAHIMGANAIVGIHLDYETVGSRGAMLMVTVAGTAVNIRAAKST